ncbi:hypothetical protein A7975_05995 [Bacillus sp. FJAT-26390]|nr:hypothetical protein A7975_05995 [Bacillus sp. FJAT-26390]
MKAPAARKAASAKPWSSKGAYWKGNGNWEHFRIGVGIRVLIRVGIWVRWRVGIKRGLLRSECHQVYLQLFV